MPKVAHILLYERVGSIRAADARNNNKKCYLLSRLHFERHLGITERKQCWVFLQKELTG